MRPYADRSGLIVFLGAERYGSARKMVDHGNHEMWSMNIVIDEHRHRR